MIGLYDIFALILDQTNDFHVKLISSLLVSVVARFNTLDLLVNLIKSRSETHLDRRVYFHQAFHV